MKPTARTARTGQWSIGQSDGRTRKRTDVESATQKDVGTVQETVTRRCNNTVSGNRYRRSVVTASARRVRWAEAAAAGPIRRSVSSLARRRPAGRHTLLFRRRHVRRSALCERHIEKELDERLERVWPPAGRATARSITDHFRGRHCCEMYVITAPLFVVGSTNDKAVKESASRLLIILVSYSFGQRKQEAQQMLR